MEVGWLEGHVGIQVAYEVVPNRLQRGNARCDCINLRSEVSRMVFGKAQQPYEIVLPCIAGHNPVGPIRGCIANDNPLDRPVRLCDNAVDGARDVLLLVSRGRDQDVSRVCHVEGAWLAMPARSAGPGLARRASRGRPRFARS